MSYGSNLKNIFYAAFVAGIIPTQASAADEQQVCIEQFEIDRGVCRSEHRGPNFATCMQTATAKKTNCIKNGPSEEFFAQLIVEPAEVKSFTLSELGLSSDVFVSAASTGDLDTGTPEALVKNGLLNIGATGDIGVDQTFTIRLEDAQSNFYPIELTVPTKGVFNLSAVTDAPDIFNPEPQLSISGITSGIVTNDIVLTIDDVQLSPMSEFKLTTGQKSVDATNLFTYDQSLNTFSTQRSDLLEFIAGEFNNTKNLTLITALLDNEFIAYTHTVPLLTPSVTIEGQLVGSDGNPAIGLSVDDLNIAVVGRDSNIRRVVPVASDGSFLVENLVEETYRLFVIDLEQPNFYSSPVPIFSGSTLVQSEILYNPLQKIETSK